jgi:hypothetical protein
VTRAEIEGVLLDGFFPLCDAEARPYRTQAWPRSSVPRPSMLFGPVPPSVVKSSVTVPTVPAEPVGKGRVPRCGRSHDSRRPPEFARAPPSWQVARGGC